MPRGGLSDRIGVIRSPQGSNPLAVDWVSHLADPAQVAQAADHIEAVPSASTSRSSVASQGYCTPQKPAAAPVASTSTAPTTSPTRGVLEVHPGLRLPLPPASSTHELMQVVILVTPAVVSQVYGRLETLRTDGQLLDVVAQLTNVEASSQARSRPTCWQCCGASPSRHAASRHGR